jgi:hypothetical protein
MSKLQINKIDAFLARAHRFGYTLTSTTISDMLHDSDNVLFQSVKNPNHCIHSLLPPVRDVSMDLRSKCYELPMYHYQMFKRSFILRSIYADSY